MTTEDMVRKKYEALSPLMDERMRRCWAGIEAELLGEGEIAIVERATGMSRTTIRAGRDELRGGIDSAAVVEVRRRGGGWPRLEELHPSLIADLESLVDPVTRGDPESPLRWTTKSTRKLAAELTERGTPISRAVDDGAPPGLLVADQGYGSEDFRQGVRAPGLHYAVAVDPKSMVVTIGKGDRRSESRIHLEQLAARIDKAGGFRRCTWREEPKNRFGRTLRSAGSSGPEDPIHTPRSKNESLCGC